MPTLDQALERAATEADLYEQSVHALLTFAALICHDGSQERDGSEFGFGRRMHILAEDGPEEGEEDAEVDGEVPEVEDEPPPEVTPDLVAQKSTSYGVAVEAKAGMASGDDVWASYSRQVLKYTARLEGWWTPTEQIATSDSVLMLHRSRARRFVRFVEGTKPAPLPEKDGLAVVEFVRSNQVQTFYSFTLEWGSLRDQDLTDALLDSREVPLERVIETYAQIQFYDVEPPLPTLLEVMWGAFLSRIGELDRDEEKGCWLLKTTAEEVTDELQKAFGSQALHQDVRSVEFPRVSWVREALQKLKMIGLARLEEDGSFTVFVKLLKPNADVRDEFVRRLYAHGSKARQPAVEPTPDQTSLPLD